MSDGNPQKFEEKLDRIDAIVKELEGGKVDLDRAIALFQEGKTLARDCEALLKNAQDQIDRAMAEPATAGETDLEIPF
ncbi:MAG TPA: exodeoxyribonuclease VII small subunit [Candidatus Baltobacteraceae bacterium]|nr:exodeoxyribonuclease VII small subunit [Candidatus Baltobacteraceae bacterium]